MILFSVISIPLFFIYRLDNFKNKSIIYFISGVFFSSLITLVFWSFKNLMIVESSTFFTHIFNLILVSTIPLIFMVLLYLLNVLKNKDDLLLKKMFCGFAYWNYLFLIFTGIIDNKIAFISIPFLFIILVDLIYKLDNLELKFFSTIQGLEIYLFVILILFIESLFFIHTVTAIILILITVILYVFFNLKYINKKYEKNIS